MSPFSRAPALPGLVRTTGVLAALLLLTSCSDDPDQAEAAAAARAFVSAVPTPERACALLAPGTQEEMSADGPCADAVHEADLPRSTVVRQVDVAGHAARVTTGEDVVFLALFDDGWKVTAAGCSPKGADDALPYDCDVKGN